MPTVDLTQTLRVNLLSTYERTNLHKLTTKQKNPTDRINKKLEGNLSNGAGTAKAGILWYGRFTTGGSISQDLTGLTDSFGNTLNVSAVKTIIVKNLGSSTILFEYRKAGIGTLLFIATLSPGAVRVWHDPQGHGIEVSESEDFTEVTAHSIEISNRGPGDLIDAEVTLTAASEHTSSDSGT